MSTITLVHLAFAICWNSLTIVWVALVIIGSRDQGAFMKLKEIAAKILEHLERFEHDPKINDRGSSISPYWNVNAWAAGSKVGVKYVSFQCEHFLTKAEALEYLQWLDSGKVGKHFSVLKRK